MIAFIIALCFVATILICRIISRRAQQKREEQRAHCREIERAHFADLLRKQTSDKVADSNHSIEEV